MSIKSFIIFYVCDLLLCGGLWVIATLKSVCNEDLSKILEDFMGIPNNKTAALKDSILVLFPIANLLFPTMAIILNNKNIAKFAKFYNYYIIGEDDVEN